MSSVLVTGGCGFVGSAVVRVLAQRGHDITVVDDLSTGTLANVHGVEGHVVRNCQISDVDRMAPLVSRSDYVIHLAARAFIPPSFRQPVEYLETNALGAEMVARLCATSGVKRLVHISSAEVYGSAVYEPMTEEHPTNPVSPYAVAKLLAEELVRYHMKYTGLRAVILRLFNAYGPRGTLPYIVPEAVRQFSAGGEVHFGNLNGMRDFTFVEDTAAAIVAAMDAPGADAETINVGSGCKLSIADVVESVRRAVGTDVAVGFDPSRCRPIDVGVLVADPTKASELLHWTPRTTFAIGLRKTLEWYRDSGGWAYERPSSG